MVTVHTPTGLPENVPSPEFPVPEFLMCWRRIRVVIVGVIVVSWSLFAQPNEEPLRFSRIGTYPRHLRSITFTTSQRGFGLSNDRLMTSPDGGRTWQVVLPQGTEPEVVRGYSMITPRLGFALGRRHLYATRDGGITWVRQTSVNCLPQGFVPMSVSANKEADSIWLGGSVPLSRPPTVDDLSGDIPAILFMHGEARDWRVSRLSDFGEFGISEFVGPRSGPRIALGRHCVYFLNAASKEWTLADLGSNGCGAPDSRPITGMFVDDLVGWISFTSGVLCQTGDGGARWTQVMPGSALWTNREPAGFTSLHFFSMQSGYGVSSGLGRLYRTRDGGTSWSIVNAPERLLQLGFRNRCEGWAVGEKNLYSVSAKGSAECPSDNTGSVN